ncbi:MAG: flagellar basal body-associated FliL family protein [Desulfonatronovibrionaceae bacterium]
MAARDKDQQDTQEETKKTGKLKWILLALLLLVLGGAGYFGYTYFMENDGQEEDQEQEEAAPEVDPKKSQIVDLEPFVVNLNDPLGRRYLRTTLKVEVIDSQAAQDVEKHMARVRDSIILLLSSKSYSQLDTMEKKIRLRNEIVERLNQFIGQGRVIRVYFSEFVIQ